MTKRLIGVAVTPDSAVSTHAFPISAPRPIEPAHSIIEAQYNQRSHIVIRVSVLYQNAEGKKFDMAYYCTKHIPMLKQKLGSACKRVDIDQGMGGAQPGSKPAFVAMAHLTFDSVDAFQKAFGPHSDAIMGDIPNYTNIQPLIQVNEVKT